MTNIDELTCRLNSCQHPRRQGCAERQAAEMSRAEKLRALLADMTEDEKREILVFIQLLKARQVEKRSMTGEELQELVKAACKRLGKGNSDE